MEILFYHLELSPLEKVLPILLEKTLERGWRAGVEVSGEEKAKHLDAILWTFNNDSFLAHAIAGDKDANEQPILIATDENNQNSANVRFFVAGKTPELNIDYAKDYERIVFMFDGHDPDIVEKARNVWKELKSDNELTYWQQDASGQWKKKG